MLIFLSKLGLVPKLRLAFEFFFIFPLDPARIIENIGIETRILNRNKSLTLLPRELIFNLSRAVAGHIHLGNWDIKAVHSFVQLSLQIVADLDQIRATFGAQKYFLFLTDTLVLVVVLIFDYKLNAFYNRS